MEWSWTTKDFDYSKSSALRLTRSEYEFFFDPLIRSIMVITPQSYAYVISYMFQSDAYLP